MLLTADVPKVVNASLLVLEKNNSFPKTSRLLSKSDFSNLKSGSRRFKSLAFIVYYKPNDLAQSRLGISVSKKVGKAVVRNRYKRLCRESFRLHHGQVSNLTQYYDFLFVCLKREKQALIDAESFRQQIEHFFSKIYGKEAITN